MDIKDIEVLIECKRLVEAMLYEKEFLLSKLDENGKETHFIKKSIARMERALQGKPPATYSNLQIERRFER